MRKMNLKKAMMAAVVAAMAVVTVIAVSYTHLYCKEIIQKHRRINKLSADTTYQIVLFANSWCFKNCLLYTSRCV